MAGVQGNHNAQRMEPVTVLEILNDFADKTTAHAIPEIILNPRILTKLVWSLLLTIAFLLFCIQTSNLLSNYYTSNTKVKLVNSEFVEFPAVTVCNFNRMKRSQVRENSRYDDVLLLESPEFLKEHIEGLSNYYWLFPNDYVWDSQVSNSESTDGMERDRKRRETFSYESLYSYSDYSYGLEWDGLIDLFNQLGDDFASKILDKIAPTKEELRTMGHQAKDFILQCNFNKAKCDYRNFTTSQNKQYGNCFTFNITQKQRRGRVTKVGSDYGLHLTLFIDALQYIGLFTEESGVRLAIHPKNILPHPEDVGISLTPGFSTSIGLRQVELKRLGGRYGECTDKETKNHLSSDKYDYSIISCQKKCLLDHMKERCGCVNNIYDDYANVPYCKDERLGKSQVQCQRQVERSFYTNRIKCTCPAPCHEYVYNTKLSTARWPSETYEPHLRDKLKAEDITAFRSLDKTKFSRENLVRLQIYFEELNYELIEQVPAYTVAEVLSNIGGTLGLYIGFSALTVFEVIILCYHLARNASKKVLPTINTTNTRTTSNMALYNVSV
ncbi:Amiloride-sensitive sodium channel subunit beta [Holothuria leucospilota]|uniref:Amiloride-sensitive sodium channel subunit beta n=1 Tax=Holothuria leucospilota TaxID=206669 RepID=A0A9Q0YHN5_HOLLE|nr:Amiloride-sensitive sodium channel subunit beta [Holothuria leucospilota]